MTARRSISLFRSDNKRSGGNLAAERIFGRPEHSVFPVKVRKTNSRQTLVRESDRAACILGKNRLKFIFIGNGVCLKKPPNQISADDSYRRGRSLLI